MQIWRFYTNNSTINDALSPLQQVAHGDKSKNKWIRGNGGGGGKAYSDLLYRIKTMASDASFGACTDNVNNTVSYTKGDKYKLHKKSL